TRWLSTIPLTNRGDQILLERAIEVEHGIEAPVGARGGVVDVGRPGIDDALALRIHLVADRRRGKRRDDDVVDLGGGGIERGEVVRRALEALARGRRQREQPTDPG